MQLVYFTPAVGMNVLIACYRFEKPIMTLYRATIAFFVILLHCCGVDNYLLAHFEPGFYWRLK